jgi:hypothetical protein
MELSVGVAFLPLSFALFARQMNQNFSTLDQMLHL